jgi:probable O-glycosylation ligase (exosortase A-associated)
MAAGATLVSLFTTKDRVSFPRHPAVYVLIAFVAWMCVTTVFAFYRPDAMLQLQKVLKIQLMTLVALAVLQEKKHIELFIWINVLSLGFFGVKGGIYTLMTGGGGKVWGPGGFIGGNNEIGLALIIAIPLMNFLRLTATQAWIRHGMLGAMLLSATAALGTQSRGGFLAIAGMAFVLWLRTPKKALFGGLIVMATVFLLGFMPGEWADRMRTIQNYEQDTSAMGRINAWWAMYNLANDRLTGGGFDVYTGDVFARYAPDPKMPRAAHSIYFQVLGEHGWLGLVLFLAIWILVWRGANALRRQTRDDPEHRWIYLMAGMCQVSLVGYAVGGAFLSLAYYDFPYNILIIIVVTQRWLAEKLKARQEARDRAGGATEASLREPTAYGARP